MYQMIGLKPKLKVSEDNSKIQIINKSKDKTMFLKIFNRLKYKKL